MFLDGPFLQAPFLDNGEVPADISLPAQWTAMLAQDDAPIAYTAEIEPWVLADRS